VQSRLFILRLKPQLRQAFLSHTLLVITLFPIKNKFQWFYRIRKKKLTKKKTIMEEKKRRLSSNAAKTVQSP
jgi:hypothetical protein